MAIYSRLCGEEIALTRYCRDRGARSTNGPSAGNALRAAPRNSVREHPCLRALNLLPAEIHADSKGEQPGTARITHRMVCSNASMVPGGNKGC